MPRGPLYFEFAPIRSANHARNSFFSFGLYRTATAVPTRVIRIWKLRRIPDMHHAATGC
jgi:hypothetical protein